MFESLQPNPGEQGQVRASRIFYILAIGNVAGAVLAFFQYRSPLLKVVGVVLSLAFAGLAYLTAKGLDDGKRWAKVVGIILAILTLLNFPIGTVVGVVALVYLNRASKAGLLSG